MALGTKTEAEKWNKISLNILEKQNNIFSRHLPYASAFVLVNEIYSRGQCYKTFLPQKFTAIPW